MNFTSTRESKYFILAVSFLELLQSKIPFFKKQDDKITKYWKNQSTQEIVTKADEYFREGRYMDIYEILNRMKFSKEVEVLWRIGQALYYLSLSNETGRKVKIKMMEEAHSILSADPSLGEENANYNKWTAIIINERNSLRSFELKVRQYPVVRDHLLKACQLNPDDFAVQYMLGRWCYEIANLTWLQRKIVKCLYHTEPPTSSYDEAYKHLLKAEELRPRSFLPNLFVLGQVCFKLGFYYSAKYYLEMALTLSTRSDAKKWEHFRNSAKSMLKKLKNYDMGRELLSERKT